MFTTVGRIQWTREEIASLDNAELARLTHDEMVELVLTVGGPFAEPVSVRAMEGDALMRLVRWSRECCRSQALV